ncbi:MAG: hypothetical protein KIT34_01650 [Cyanobacteria bacterium TGS_CYA1]|nr:hypothetical protein [Cyanobacteria bacterium TGS_CYA1]
MDDMIKVALRFPKARIYINNLLLEDGKNCCKALFSASLEYGILPWGTNLVLPPHMKGTDCQALCAAELILEKHLEHRGIKDPKRHVAALHSNFSLFKQLDTKMSKYNVECLRYTPILFDLILQQVECA